MYYYLQQAIGKHLTFCLQIENRDIIDRYTSMANMQEMKSRRCLFIIIATSKYYNNTKEIIIILHCIIHNINDNKKLIIKTCAQPLRHKYYHGGLGHISSLPPRDRVLGLALEKQYYKY